MDHLSQSEILTLLPPEAAAVFDNGNAGVAVCYVALYLNDALKYVTVTHAPVASIVDSEPFRFLREKHLHDPHYVETWSQSLAAAMTVGDMSTQKQEHLRYAALCNCVAARPHENFFVFVGKITKDATGPSGKASTYVIGFTFPEQTSSPH
jgi:hypothetical protein